MAHERRAVMRVLGLDPGLRRTGWGLVVVSGGRLRHVANGIIESDAAAPTAVRLCTIYAGLKAVIAAHAPDVAAVEETLVNRNGTATLKLGQARGIAMLAPAEAGLDVAEYAPTAVKKALVGGGWAEKAQVEAMVRLLLPGADPAGPDAADALAVAICHAHHAESGRLMRPVAGPARGVRVSVVAR